MKTLLIIILAFISLKAISQSPDDALPFSDINKEYLEHLIKEKIDNVRKNHNCKSLANDSILYSAAKGHSEYLKKFKRLSHFEANVPEKHSPQLRVEFHGVKNYLVGENVAKTSFHKAMKNKSGRKYTNRTYGQLAFDFVDAWVKSPGHFANIIKADYQVTGLAVDIDYDKKTVYAVQKFARVLWKYYFKENKQMFSYSNYVTADTVKSFEGISRKPNKEGHE